MLLALLSICLISYCEGDTIVNKLAKHGIAETLRLKYPDKSPEERECIAGRIMEDNSSQSLEDKIEIASVWCEISTFITSPAGIITILLILLLFIACCQCIRCICCR